MTFSKLGMLAASAALLMSSLIVMPSMAQDVRINPFLPNSTPEERELLAQKERMRQAVREMMPEIRTMLQPVFEEQKTTLLEEIKANAEAVALASGAAGDNGAAPLPGSPQAPDQAQGAPAEPTIEGTSIPATAKFVACFNGKAMYRDANGTKYFNENASAVCPS